MHTTQRVYPESGVSSLGAEATEEAGGYKKASVHMHVNPLVNCNWRTTCSWIAKKKTEFGSTRGGLDRERLK